MSLSDRRLVATRELENSPPSSRRGAVLQIPASPCSQHICVHVINLGRASTMRLEPDAASPTADSLTSLRAAMQHSSEVFRAVTAQLRRLRSSPGQQARRESATEERGGGDRNGCDVWRPLRIGFECRSMLRSVRESTYGEFESAAAPGRGAVSSFLPDMRLLSGNGVFATACRLPGLAEVGLDECPRLYAGREGEVGRRR